MGGEEEPSASREEAASKEGMEEYRAGIGSV